MALRNYKRPHHVDLNTIPEDYDQEPDNNLFTFPAFNVLAGATLLFLVLIVGWHWFRHCGLIAE